MSDYAHAGADLLLAVVAAVGIYYSVKTRELFKGDVMQRVFELVAWGLILLTAVAVLDLFLEIANYELQIPLVLVATVVAVGLIVAAQISLFRWAVSPEK